MIPEDIERLIGGYATGTLSEEERRKLFEAALDDQDLFDALQGEHALKQLLDDPVSREMVRRAAAGPVSQTGTSRFLRRWVWAVAGVGALAAALLVISFVKFRQPPKPLAEIAQVHREVSPVGALPAAPPFSDAVTALAPEHKLKAKRLENAPPSVPPPQSSAGQLAPQIVGGFGGQDQMQAPAPSFRASGTQPQQNALRSAPLAASAPLPASISYTLSRKMPDGSYLDVSLDAATAPGEMIRVTVVPRIAGPLAVRQWDAAHPTPTRIFPLVDVDTVQLRAMENYVVPLDIVVTAGEHLRLTVGSDSVEIAFPPGTP